MTKLILPPALAPGGTIGLCAPASWLTEQKLNQGVKALEEAGYQVYVHPQNLARDGQRAGNVADRVAAIHDLFKNPKIDAIMATRGYYGSLNLLTELDYDLIRNHPKPFIGFSDISGMLHAIASQSGVVTFHGPMASVLHPGNPASINNLTAMHQLLSGHKRLQMPATSLQPGKAQGVLVGGNLTIFSLLQGTPYLPKAESYIYVVEDTGVHINELDNKLTHLKNAGLLGKISGVVLGEFTDLKDNDVPFGHDIPAILQNYFGADVPIAYNAAFGHGSAVPTLPIGVEATLTVTAKTAELDFGGSVVRTG